MTSSPTPRHSGEIAVRHGWLGRRLRELGLVAWVAFAWIPPEAAAVPWGLLAGLLLMALSPLTWIAFRHPGAIEVEPAGLLIERGGRKRFVRDDQVEGAWLEEADAVIALAGGDRVLFRGAGQELLKSARVDAGTLATRLRFFRPVRTYGAFIVGLVAMIPLVLGVQSIAVALGAGDDVRDAVGISVAFVAMFALLRWVSASDLVVGLDGVLVPRAFGRRFVPHPEIARVEVYRASLARGRGLPVVRLGLVGGKTLDISDFGGASAEALVARIREAGEAAARAHRRAAGDALLDPYAPVAERLAAATLRRAQDAAGGVRAVLAIRRASARPELRRGLGGAGRPPAVGVGPDGLRLEGRRGVLALPYRAITQFVAEAGAVRLSLEGGRTVRAPLAGLGDAARARLVAALEAARAPAPPTHARFARGGWPLPAWRERVVALVEKEEGYREVAVTVDDARAALDAPTSSPEERLGAAFALAAREADRPRVQAVATRVAAPALRRALEAVLDDELDDDLVAAATASASLDDATWRALLRAGLAVTSG